MYVSNKAAIFYVKVLLRYIQNLEERQKILLARHIDSTSCHMMGKTRTLYRIKERFIWHGMVKDVVSLVSSLFNCMVLLYFLYFKFNPGSVIFLQLLKCDVCQLMNRRLITGVPELHPMHHGTWLELISLALNAQFQGTEVATSSHQ